MNAQAIEWYFQYLEQEGMLAENYAWADRQLENNYLQEDQAEEEEEEEQWDEAVIPMEISEEEEEEGDVPMDIYEDEDEEYGLVPIQLFPDTDEENDEDIVLDMVLPDPPVLQRSNTICYQDLNGTIYNGNPNGSRFFNIDPDADDE